MLSVRAKNFGSILTEFAFDKGMENIKYSRLSLTASSWLSKFALDSWSSKCYLDTPLSVEKYLVINRLSSIGRWVDPTHFMPVMRQNSLIENLPRSSPTSNQRASPIHEWSVNLITMLWKSCPAQPRVLNLRNCLMHRWSMTAAYCFGVNHWLKFLQISLMLIKVFILALVMSVSGTRRLYWSCGHVNGNITE